MRAQLYSVQGLSTGQISVMARPRGGDWLFDEIKALCEAGVDVLVSLLTPDESEELELGEEAEWCARQELVYYSLPIPDLSVPPFSTDTFAFLEQLKVHMMEGKHVALHCRQGLGRSPLIAAGVLVLMGFVPDQACALLSTARGYAVPETEEQRAWIGAFYRKKFNDELGAL
jgi:protein-tyrosine phosphatase